MTDTRRPKAALCVPIALTFGGQGPPYGCGFPCLMSRIGRALRAVYNVPMPELPDVEIFKRYVDATSLHQPIRRVSIPAPAVLKGISAQRLGAALHGRALQRTRRHGKYLFVAIDGHAWLMLHFGMTGHPEYFKKTREAPRFTCALLTFNNGYHLAYVAPRKLGRISLTEDPDTFIADHRLGPDALALDLRAFRRHAAGRRATVKAWLMDQGAIAGLGNIYADESLYQAGIHPQRHVHRLSRVELTRLYRKMREVLRTAIRARVDPGRMPRGYLLPHRHRHARCPHCRAALRHATIAGRTAYFCPRCQPAGE